MEAKDLIDAMGDVDGKYIEEAAGYKRPGSRALKVWRGIAIAACVCLAGTLGLSTVVLLSNSAGSGETYRAKTAVENDYYTMEANYEDAAVYSVKANYAASEEAAYDMAEDGAANGNEVWNGAETKESGAAVNENTKIVYTVWMDMQTKEFDAAIDGIEAVTAHHGGYFQNQNVSNSTKGYRNASFVIRVPAENLDALLEQVGGICTVTYMNKSADDVSASYYDVQSRLTTAQTKLTRLQELLSEAEDMEDIITIETAISDTEWEIDNYKGTLRDYDSLVDYSTVSISINEVYEVVNTEAPLTFSERLSLSFNHGLKSFGDFMAGVLLWFVNSWTVLLLLAVIAVVVILIIKGCVRRRRNRKNKS